MPISSGAMGLPGILAIPGMVKRLNPVLPTMSSVGRFRKFRSPPFSTVNPVITGVTRDASEVPLGGCVVNLFRTLDDSFLATTISDGAGAFTIFAVGSGPFYLVAYKAGSPDVAGTTVNTLSAD